jgi:hypothetical protein
MLRFAIRCLLLNFTFAGVLFVVCPTTMRAQDHFEIHVYEYEELPTGGFTLEGHFNFVGIGTNSFVGTVAAIGLFQHAIRDRLLHLGTEVRDLAKIFPPRR